MTGLAPDALAQLAAVVVAAGGARAALPVVRARWPQLRVTIQDAFDLRDEVPALRTPRLDVHLMANDGACWHLTADPAVANALVLVDRHG